MMIKSTPAAYGAVAIALHWTIALFIVIALASGFAADQIGSDAYAALRVHVACGLAAGILTLVRIGWWWLADKKPDAAPNTEGVKGVLSRSVHILLVIIPLGMLASGVGMMVLSGAGSVLFGLVSGPLPDFDRFLPRGPHGAGAFALLALLVAHVAAALYHQYVLRDDLFKRMSLRRS
ncbi:cytochrome b/b6 domain-containing protein [Hoeflea sp. WL0058]|uniref:Cytochrome b/b6 domain-containing protein n=1 Tax=Flavimaribacter sediminis TaxID=2865987 RepID=A0AAE2ZNY9_9HYPH|nr:cytochrome b/b6 domain-containing protein [Flavimaribacter sediminis]MBW8637753.1 cytochrome b/b6 domain-containing protein [Flavimaribacter sediminis]